MNNRKYNSHKQEKLPNSVHLLETAPTVYIVSLYIILQKILLISFTLQPSSSLHQAIVRWPRGVRLISIESSVQADSSRRFRFDRSRAIWTRARLPAASQTMHLLRDRLPRECLNNDRRATWLGKGTIDRSWSRQIGKWPSIENIRSP